MKPNTPLAKLVLEDASDINNNLIDLLLDDTVKVWVNQVKVDNNLPYFTQSEVINIELRVLVT